MRLSGEHVVEGRELGKDADELERPTHPARADTVRSHADEALAAQPDVTRVRRERARDAVEERGLARTVRPDQPDDLPRLDGDVDAGQRREPAEVLGDAADLEEAHPSCWGPRHCPQTPPPRPPPPGGPGGRLAPRPGP